MIRSVNAHVPLSNVRSSLVALVLLAIIPALGLTLYTGLEQHRMARVQAEESAIRVVRLASANQERLVEGARVLLVAMARLPEVRRQDPVACSAAFADLLKQYPGYANLGAVELDGNIFCSALPMTQPVNAADRSWFQRAVPTRTFAVGDYQIGRITGRATVNLAYPVVSTASQVQAVVFVALDLGWLNHLASEADLPTGTTLTVIDGNGTVLTRYPNPERWVGLAAPDVPIVKVMLQKQQTGAAEAEGVDGVQRLYAFAPLGSGSPTGSAYITVGIPSSVAFARADRLMARNLAGLGLIALLAFAAAWVGGDLFLLRRVKALVSATRRVSAGDLSARTDLPYGKGELSELARAFDQMAQTLQARQVEARRAEEGLRLYAERLTMVHEIDRAILMAGSPESIADAALQQIRRQIPSQRASLAVFDLPAKEVRILAAHPGGMTGLEAGTRHPMGALGERLEELGEGTVVTLDVRTLPQAQLGMSVPLVDGLRYLNVVPLISQGDVIGSLNLWTESLDSLTSEQQDIAREVADQLSIALVSARIREELRQHAAVLEQRVAERTVELREAKTFLEHLISTSPGVIIRGNVADNSLGYISPNLERILGYAPREALGVPDFWPDHVHPQDREGYLPRTRQALDEKRPQVEREYRFLHKDGGYRWLHTVLRFEYDAAGNPVDVLGYALDITERKHAEEALHQARAEADRANLAKSEFLSRMSHELRTPLNAVLGFAQLLEMDSLTHEQRESVGHIVKGGKHLLELINEVLDIARIESGRLQLSLEPVLLNAVVQETLDLIRPLAVEADVQPFDETVPSPSLHLMADRQRLKQVLLNLLANAVKYNRKGGTVVLSYNTLLQGRLRINVSDTGPGIPPERLERLFMPFERLGAEQTGAEGTGLGLALSRRLVEAMGGTMGVESTVGRGSTFWVELAVAESPVQRLEREGGGMPARGEFEPAQKARVLLYVEDNLSNLKLIQRVLAHRPEIRLIPAMQGRMGIDLAREHRPKLILLDLHLPDIPGDEVLRRLREAPETHDIPVVVISADATPGQIERLLAMGALNYLTKPLDVRKFLEIVDETLGGTRPSDSLATH